MFFWNAAKRDQNRRNRAKAQSLIDQYGDGALAHVEAQVAASAWQIREQQHWQRVEKHVRALWRQRR
jgi:hypothetical protein